MTHFDVWGKNFTEGKHVQRLWSRSLISVLKEWEETGVGEMEKAAGREAGDKVKEIMGRTGRACGLPEPFKHLGFYSAWTEKIGELEQRSNVSGFVDYFGCYVECSCCVRVEDNMKGIS